MLLLVLYRLFQNSPIKWALLTGNIQYKAQACYRNNDVQHHSPQPIPSFRWTLPLIYYSLIILIHYHSVQGHICGCQIKATRAISAQAHQREFHFAKEAGWKLLLLPPTVASKSCGRHGFIDIIEAAALAASLSSQIYLFILTTLYKVKKICAWTPCGDSSSRWKNLGSPIG
jgi:hypothetical protein